MNLRWLIPFRRRAVHRHQWQTLAINCWGLPIHQICSCGISREVATDPRPHPELPGNFPRLTYRWDYSDGTHGPWLRMTDDSEVIEGGLVPAKTTTTKK